jgi:hypothetical protein
MFDDRQGLGKHGCVVRNDIVSDFFSNVVAFCSVEEVERSSLFYETCVSKNEKYGEWQNHSVSISLHKTIKKVAFENKHSSLS